MGLMKFIGNYVFDGLGLVFFAIITFFSVLGYIIYKTHIFLVPLLIYFLLIIFSFLYTKKFEYNYFEGKYEKK